MPVNLDWLQDPPPPNLTAFQELFLKNDWSNSDLGPIHTWGRELKQIVRLMLTDTAPTIIYWGDNHSILYNEGYVPFVGNKHPDLLGRRAPDAFPDFWYFFDDVIIKQREDGLTASGEASRLLMERHGFLEETYFDWKLVPIIGDDGFVLGSYGLPTDNTEHVINERRTACVKELTQQSATATSFESLWTTIPAGLEVNNKDVPFALVLTDDDVLGIQPSIESSLSSERGYRVVASVGVPKGHAVVSLTINIGTPEAGLPTDVKRAVTTSQIVLITDEDPLVASLLHGLDWSDTGRPCTEFAIVPISTGSKVPTVLLIGVNPYRRYDNWYKDFLQLITDVLASAISKMRLQNELRYRSEMAKQARRAFEESELRFYRFAGRLPVGLAVADMSGKVLYANESWCSFSGKQPSQLDGTLDFRDTIFEDDLPTLLEYWQKVAVFKEPVTFHYRSKAPFHNGNMYLPNRILFAACYADLDANGDVETVTGLVIDMSEQKWIEQQLVKRSQELEKSEQRYRSFADLCPFGIVSTNSDGYVQFGNDSWHDFYGFKKGEVHDPEPWVPYIHDADTEKVKQYFRDLQTIVGPHNVELRLKKKYTMRDGDRTLENDAWVLATGIQEYRPDGSIDHMDFWVVDISAQKMAEKVLTEKMMEAIRTRTQQERFVDMISHEIRNPLSAVLHCGEEIVESVKQCLLLLSRTSSNTALASHTSSTDQAEQLLANSLESANTVLYCVQHQKQIVDDVLTLSKLDSELLVVSPVPVNLADLLQSAVKIFEPELRMSNIAFNLQDDQSIAESRVDWILLDPNRFLQILINLITNAIKFTKACETRKIIVQASVHQEPPRHLDDLQYVPRRYDALERERPSMQTKKESSLKQFFLRVSVSDTGKGLTQEEKSRLFNRFAQASPKTEVEYGGSGLGLFISRQMTEMLGGEIGVGVSPSGGCTFAFYVTTFKIEAPTSYKLRSSPLSNGTMRTMSAPVTTLPTQKVFREGTPSLQPGKRKILVVEDNIVNQKVLCKQLRNRGFDVEASNHGREALAALEKAQGSRKGYFDVILCDIEMPIMNGIECVREIRAREADGRLAICVPVIGVTANVRSKQVDNAIEAGMNGVTTKPYRIDDLISNIDRYCGPEARPG